MRQSSTDCASDDPLETSEDQIDDLRRRIAATRWPSKEVVPDRSQSSPPEPRRPRFGLSTRWIVFSCLLALFFVSSRAMELARPTPGPSS